MKATKADNPWRHLAVPAALIGGFLFGFVIRGPVLKLQEPSSQIEDSFNPNPVLTPPPAKQASTKASPQRVSDPSRGWDEKSIQSLPLKDIKARLTQLSTWPAGPEADRVERWLVKRWAALEPREACQYAYAAVLQGAETSLLEESIKVWAEISPAMASNWASSLGSPSLRDLAVRIVFQVWAGKDATAAAQAAGKLRSAAARTTATVAVAPPQARKNFPAAMTWARGLPGAKRQKTLEEILGEWTKRDPASASMCI